MTGAQLKTLRESLGLTAQWIADQAGVRLRTAQYWEAGGRGVPDDVAALLMRVEAMHQHGLAAALAQLDDTIARMGEPPEVVELRRYGTDAELWDAHPDLHPLPASCHAALLARVFRALEARGQRAVIEYAS